MVEATGYSNSSDGEREEGEEGNGCFRVRDNGARQDH